MFFGLRSLSAELCNLVSDLEAINSAGIMLQASAPECGFGGREAGSGGDGRGGDERAPGQPAVLWEAVAGLGGRQKG